MCACHLQVSKAISLLRFEVCVVLRLCQDLSVCVDEFLCFVGEG